MLVMVGVPAKVKVDNSEQYAKALAPMLVTVAGTVKVVSAEQLLKALLPMVVTAGVPAKLTAVSLSLPWKE